MNLLASKKVAGALPKKHLLWARQGMHALEKAHARQSLHSSEVVGAMNHLMSIYTQSTDKNKSKRCCHSHKYTLDKQYMAHFVYGSC